MSKLTIYAALHGGRRCINATIGEFESGLPHAPQLQICVMRTSRADIGLRMLAANLFVFLTIIMLNGSQICMTNLNDIVF